MEIQALGYLGVGTVKLDDWTLLTTRGSGCRPWIVAQARELFAWTIDGNGW
jgi:hypothetical protein